MARDGAVSNPADLSATELLDSYRRKALSPVEAVRAVLARIEALNPKLNAFNLVDADGALAAAQASEARWAGGAPQGALDGVPASIKDLLLTRGWPTLRGSELVDPNQPWTEDAPATARLREAGAVILGKTTTPEFGWKALGDSPLTGITRNPWNLERTPGGSSAGAAAHIAAGMGPLAVGTDGGGSIRIPSSFCGIVGIKPTFGRVPAYPLSPFGVVAHVGPMTRTVPDCALMLDVLSGYDDRDPWAVPGRPSVVDGLDTGITGLRIAYSLTLGYGDVDPEVRAAVDRAAQTFAELGATVESADPGFANPRDAFMVLWTTGAAKVLSAFTAEQQARIDPGLMASARFGATKSAIDWYSADAVRNGLIDTMTRFQRRYDLLLTPSVAVPALPVGYDLSDPKNQAHWIDWTPFSYPFNMTRQPAISLPCGLTAAGLPIGLQLVGRWHQDNLVLRAARAFEKARPFTRPPAL
jgi:aspartyl-tRNA(Asn)/glutamyl-tRNA(Gln) amidotransferase subunit A